MKRRIVCHSPAARRLARNMGVRDAVAAVRLRGSALIAELPGPPFVLDVPAVLKATNVKEVRDVANSSLDGRIFRQGEGYVIELSKKLAPPRRAFTLAHELAHTFFLSDDGGSERADGSTGSFDERNEEEYLCDVAAAEMLMPARAGIPGAGLPALGEWSAPKNAFLKCVVESGPSVDSVLNLAREFGTSITATARRYAELTADDVFIAFWRLGPTGDISFEFGLTSNEVDLRIPRGFVPNSPALMAQGMTDDDEGHVPCDIGLVNSAGERIGEVLTQRRGLRSIGRIVSLSLLNDTARRVSQGIREQEPVRQTQQPRLAF